MQLTPEWYIERFQVVVWQLQSKCWLTVELYEVVGQRCTNLLIFSVFFFLTRTSWCGGENYQGHFLFTNSLWKIIGQQPTLLSIKLMKVGPPGLNTRFPAATVAIIHISGCDSLTYLLKVRVIWWLLIFLFDYQFLSECWSSGSYHLIIRSDSYDYSHLGMWQFLQSGNNRSSISLGPPLSRLDSIHTPHSHPSNVLWKLVSWVLSFDSPQQRLWTR